MKYKRIFLLMKYVIIISFAFFMSFLIFTVNGLFEMGAVNLEINNFKNRAIFEKETILQGQNVSYYKVPKKYDYEDVDRHIYDSNKYSDCYIGSKTDIILTSRNPLRNYEDAIIRDISMLVTQQLI